MSETTVHTEREDLHALIDALPDEEVHAARRYLEYLRSSEPSDRAVKHGEGRPASDDAVTMTLEQAFVLFNQGYPTDRAVGQDRAAAVERACGLLADMPTTVDDFLRERHEEAEWEEARWQEEQAARGVGGDQGEEVGA